MSESSPLLSIGIKEIIGSFSPAYISLLLYLYLSGAELDLSSILSVIFVAAIIGIALSGMQSYVIGLILRPKTFFREVKKAARKSKIANAEKVLDASLPYLKEKIDKFHLSKIELPDEERKKYTMIEGRLLCFSYLISSFVVLTIVAVYQYVIGKNVNISIQVGLLLPMISVLLLAGVLSEIRMYKKLVAKEIPLLSALQIGYNPTDLREKIGFLEEQKRNKYIGSKTYEELMKEHKQLLGTIEKLGFEKRWLIEKVSKKLDFAYEDVSVILTDLLRRIGSREEPTEDPEISVAIEIIENALTRRKLFGGKLLDREELILIHKVRMKGIRNENR